MHYCYNKYIGQRIFSVVQWDPWESSLVEGLLQTANSTLHKSQQKHFLSSRAPLLYAS